MNLGEVLQHTGQSFKEQGVLRPCFVAEELIAHILKLGRRDLYVQLDRLLTEKELETLHSLAQRKLQGEPLEYITGSISFYGCTICLTKDVLIPRVETEILLDKACRLLKTRPLIDKVAWDICTGSGCIGIALKKSLPHLQVSLSDICERALQVASANAKRNGVVVESICSDLLLGFEGKKADIFFCNPPYISEKEYETLDPSVRCFEPKKALLGGADGLFFYRQLQQLLPCYLNPGALLFFEIGALQANAMKEIFSGPCWHLLSLERDWAGHDRFFFLEFR